MASPIDQIAVVIPCYKVKDQLRPLLDSIGKEVDRIYVVDDACPQKSVATAMADNTDSRITPVYLPENRGVGGAVVAGIQAALDGGADIVIKLDGDGQYSPNLIPYLLKPLLSGQADCAKGNRFFFIENLEGMPLVRILGNTALSFVNKVSSGYWSVMDPTNGFIAWHADVLRLVPLNKLDRRYFFESDMLFRLSCIQAVVADVPLKAIYADEESSLSIWQVMRDFPGKYLTRAIKRVFYNYFLRDFNVGSLFFVLGWILSLCGMLYGLPRWIEGVATGVATNTGQIALTGMLLLSGFLFLLSFLLVDVFLQPRTTVSGSYLADKVDRDSPG